MSESTLTPAPSGYPIKLVRDNTPTIINASGEPGDLFYGQLPDDAGRVRWLRKKLAEEAAEYLVDGGWGELRDLLAVVVALAQAHGSDICELLQAVSSDPRGGFEKAVMMYGYHSEFDGSQ